MWGAADSPAWGPLDTLLGSLCKPRRPSGHPEHLTVSCQGPFPPPGRLFQGDCAPPFPSAHLTPRILTQGAPLCSSGKLPVPWPHCGSLNQ